jgi:hypothetical protein
LADPAVNLVTSGPYGLIFASFIPFFFDIPVSTWFRVFGVRFSDKSFIYLAGLQVKSEFGLYVLFMVQARPNVKFFYHIWPPHLPSAAKSNFSFCLTASFIILEKIYLTRDMWHPSWFLLSFECLSYPQGKGHLSISPWERKMFYSFSFLP